MNETSYGTTAFQTNNRGTAAFCHGDVPDAGNSDWFINLKHNEHLDTASGGYCVFANIHEDDYNSFEVLDKVAQAVRDGQRPLIRCIIVE